MRRILVLVAGLALMGLIPVAAGASEGCGNEALREERHLTFLPGCRAYEMVSPSEKNGGGVTLGTGAFRASSTGGAMIFDSDVGADDTRGTGSIAAVTFRSDRGANSWATQSLSVAQNVNLFGPYNSQSFGWFAPDLSHAMLDAGDPALVPGAPQGIPNLYLTDGVGGSPQLLTPAISPYAPGPFNGETPVDTSTDFGRVAFESTQRLTSDTPFGVYSTLYDWDHGTVHLVGILPDGTPAPERVVASAEGAGFSDTEEAFSDDGARLYFTTPNNGYLYLRRDNSSTAWVSQSEASSPDATPGPADFRGASADGMRAVFTSEEHLLDADHDTAKDLYLYTDSPNPASESNLTLLSEDHEPSDGTEDEGRRRARHQPRRKAGLLCR